LQLQRNRRLRRDGAAAKFGLARNMAAFLDDLIESAVEPRQRLADVVGRAFVARRLATAGYLALGDTLDLAGEVVETGVDVGEVVADFIIDFIVAVAA
jgi:hypothetical protein